MPQIGSGALPSNPRDRSTMRGEVGCSQRERPATSAAVVLCHATQERWKWPSLSLTAMLLILTPSPVTAIQPETEALATQPHYFPDAQHSPPQGDTSPSTQSVGPDRSAAAVNSGLAILPSTMPARIVIRYLGSSVEAHNRATGIAQVLSTKGVEVADVRESAVTMRTELQFYYVTDQAVAQQIGYLIGISPARAALAKDGLSPQPGAILLSVSGR